MQVPVNSHEWQSSVLKFFTSESKSALICFGSCFSFEKEIFEEIELDLSKEIFGLCSL